ncbi:MAG: carboxypeptidase regulatory-like domain-containing protein [Planctomycetes bacterium]|nr:carboxypeptidase regulatory-like domain-containing protein [Planctomycetota bacterium]
MVALRLVFALGLLAIANVRAQEPELPADLRAALLAKPVQTAPVDGQSLLVVDDATGAPIAGAVVFIVPKGSPFRRPTGVPGPDVEQSLLITPFLQGQRFAAGADGVAVLPPCDQAIAMTEAGLGMLMPARGTDGRPTIRVCRTTVLRVRAVNAQGQAVPNVPLSIGMLDGRDGLFGAFGTGVSDARGEVEFRLPGLYSAMGSKNYKVCVQLQMVGGTPCRAMLETGSDQPSDLVVPAIGRVVVRLYDEQEHPRSGLKSVELLPPAAPRSRQGMNILPVRSTADEAEYVVALEQQLVAHAVADGVAGEIRHEQPGPTQAGELVVFGVRTTASSPILIGRLVDDQGRGISGRPVRAWFANDRGVGAEHLTTAADGAFSVAVPESVRAEAFDVQFVADERAVLQAGVASMPGRTDLGELRLAPAPVAVAGTVVGLDGQAIPGVRVVMTRTWALGERGWAVVGDAEVAATSGADGAFALAELAPRRKAAELTLGDRGMVVIAGGEVPLPVLGHRLVVAPAGRLRVSFSPRAPGLLHVNVTQAGGRPHGWAEDQVTGERLFDNLHPGTADVEITLRGRRVARFEAIAIPAGSESLDPRLREVAWTEGFVVSSLHVRTANGEDARGVRVGVVRRGQSVTSQGPQRWPETMALLPDDEGFAVSSPYMRTVLVKSPEAKVELTQEPRRRAQFTLPAGSALPVGVHVTIRGLDEVSRFGEPLHRVWSFAEDAFSLDGPGRHRIEFRRTVHDPEALWWGEIEVDSGVEPVLVALPITKDELQSVVARLGRVGK